MDFEGRAAPRLESENLLAFRILDKDDKIIQEGMVKTLDISRTGIAIESKQPMEIGAKIILTIGMGDEIVRTSGTIQNQKQIADQIYHIGIEFDFLTDEDLNKIGMVYPSILK